ncbi:MAG: UDP-glucose 4-epimerase GalE [Negativicutes bacterium]|nr:UDP-glucose 4-epimerase GalE [Negativicutes bacterium]
MKVMVSGGAGYIGSHTCVALLQAGHQVIIADNFSNSQPEVLQAIRKISGKDFIFAQIDVTDSKAVQTLFQTAKPDGVIHFAGLKAVGESMSQPLAYYRNNLLSTIVLAEACLAQDVRQFVFSSSATVYGANPSPLREDMALLPTTNPYGETKVVSERILTDTAAANPGFAVALLRYFNPVGAHSSGLLGENPNGLPNNLMPNITRAAAGRLPALRIFGSDYETPDGTCIRDYIHVMDLAEGHLAALDHLRAGTQIYNLGRGEGASVFQLMNAFEEATGNKVAYQIEARRPGDLAVSYADVSKAERELQWRAKRDLISMCRDAWRYEENLLRKPDR